MRLKLTWPAAAATAAAVALLGSVVTTAALQASSVGTRRHVAAHASTPELVAPAQALGVGAPIGPLPRQLFVPDLIAAAPTGLSGAQLGAIARLPGVRATLTVSGGQVTVDGRSASVIGADPQAFRAWTPPKTAADATAWASLSQGSLLARAPHVAGGQATVVGKTTVTLPASAVADLGIPGVDAVVDQQRSAQLGLAASVAVLINAPGADLRALMPRIRALLGPRGQVRNLVPVVVYSKLPVAVVPTSAVPANYLQLYQESAARYCAGLSWTVLAAIGEIESGHGVNTGPSSAGALGPMQFLPSTWAIYGIDGFTDTGRPDIMNPLDAVPSAVHMLCADGATSGAAGLRAAIFAYNHADWYVTDVLQLAAEYAAAYP